MTAFPDDRERDVRRYLKDRLKALGGELRKVRWQGRNKAPDELLLVPARAGYQPLSAFAELKRPGEEPDTGQWREINRLRSYGLRVVILDSREAVDKLLFWA